MLTHVRRRHLRRDRGAVRELRRGLRGLLRRRYLRHDRRGDKRTEEINAALGTTTSQVFLPIAKLLAKKRIKKKGAKRATEYFAAGR